MNINSEKLNIQKLGSKKINIQKLGIMSTHPSFVPLVCTDRYIISIHLIR